jgi:hypothetical protein
MRRSILIAGGVAILVLLLAGAAFLGARMLRAPGGIAPGVGGDRVMEIVSDDGSGPVSLRIKVEPSHELPDRPADVNGVFVRRQDNSIFVGTGAIELDVEVEVKDGREERTVTTHHSGPEVEVVTTRDTIIYRDETDISPGALGSRKSGEIAIEQVIRPTDSLEEVGEHTELQVWGDRRGDRVVAEVVVYRLLNE